MDSFTFHINLYDLILLGTTFVGLTFALLLWFTKSVNRGANRILSLVLVTIVSQITWLLCIHIRMPVYFPRWDWLPLQFSLAVGPLIFFYVLKITRPEYEFRWKDILHFIPLILQLGILIFAIKQNSKTLYNTIIFRGLNPVFQLIVPISVIIYLYRSHRLIQRFYKG